MNAITCNLFKILAFIVMVLSGSFTFDILLNALVIPFRPNFNLSLVVRKPAFGGIRPGPTQTGLYSHRIWREVWNFGFISVAKTKAPISICVFVFAYAKSRFSHDEAHLKMLFFPTKQLHHAYVSVLCRPFTSRFYSRIRVYKGIHCFLIVVLKRRLWVLVRKAFIILTVMKNRCILIWTRLRNYNWIILLSSNRIYFIKSIIIIYS